MVIFHTSQPINDTLMCDQFLYLRYIAAANSTAASNVLASHLPNISCNVVSFDLLIICQLMASVEVGCNESVEIFKCLGINFTSLQWCCQAMLPTFSIHA